MSHYCWLYSSSEQLHKEGKHRWRKREGEISYSRSLRKYILDPGPSMPLPHAPSQLSWLDKALVLNDSSNGISSILSQDHCRFLQASLLQSTEFVSANLSLLSLTLPHIPHPADNSRWLSCLQSVICILRFNAPGTQPGRSLLSVQELASCNGLFQASSQASTFSPSPYDKQYLKGWVWLKMLLRPEDEMCLYLGFTAV